MILLLHVLQVLNFIAFIDTPAVLASPHVAHKPRNRTWSIYTPLDILSFYCPRELL